MDPIIHAAILPTNDAVNFGEKNSSDFGSDGYVVKAFAKVY